MKFQTLKKELERWEENEKKCNAPILSEPSEVCQTNPKRIIVGVCQRERERVLSGDILWRPIDRAAGMLLSKAPWWARPVVYQPEQNKAAIGGKLEKKQRKNKRNHMSNKVATAERGGVQYESEQKIPGSNYVSNEGLHITMVNGEPMFRVEEVQAFIVAECQKMAAEVRPIVKDAQDARKIVDELVRGLGGNMDTFRAQCKVYLEDIRQTRYAIVGETSQMTASLKDVRQFFLGHDYKEQIQRLTEFVDLCERLNSLKASGFLDKVADTMLSLTHPNS